MALSPKHRVFCEEYLKTWNATDAYQAAYPKSSRETARRNGSRLLTNADISEEIQRRVDEQTMSANEVLSRLAEQARGEQRQDHGGEACRQTRRSRGEENPGGGKEAGRDEFRENRRRFRSCETSAG